MSLTWNSAKVVSIESDPHFADYAEPANVPIQVQPSPTKRFTYDHCIGVGLAMLAGAVLLALVLVAAEYNY